MVTLTTQEREAVEKSRAELVTFIWIVLAIVAVLSVLLFYWLGIKTHAPILQMLESLKQIASETVEGAVQLEKTSEFLANGALHL